MPVLAGLSLPVRVFDFSGFVALPRSASATDGAGSRRVRALPERRHGRRDEHGGDTVPARRRNGADLVIARERIFLPAAVRAIAEVAATPAMRHLSRGRHRAGRDGRHYAARSGSPRLSSRRTTGATCCALTILPVPPRAKLAARGSRHRVRARCGRHFTSTSRDRRMRCSLPSAFIGKSITETTPPDVAHRALAALDAAARARRQRALRICALDVGRLALVRGQHERAAGRQRGRLRARHHGAEERRSGAARKARNAAARWARISRPARSISSGHTTRDSRIVRGTSDQPPPNVR